MSRVILADASGCVDSEVLSGSRAGRAAEGKPKPATSSGAAESVSLTPEQLLALSDGELDEWLMKNVGDAQCVPSMSCLSTSLCSMAFGWQCLPPASLLAHLVSH